MRKQELTIITLFVILDVLIIGLLIGYILRATIKPPDEPTPSENEVLFRTDNRASVLYFAINEERIKAKIGTLQYDYELSEKALHDAHNFKFTEDEAVYVISDLEEAPEQAVLKIWLTSSYRERFLLNENIERIGIITYYEDKTQKRVYVAKFR